MCRIILVLGLCAACSGKTETVNNTIAVEGDNSSYLPTQSLVISGSVFNGQDTTNTSILNNKAVEIVRSDSIVVASSQTDSSGNFVVNVAAGALVIDSSFSTTTGSNLVEDPPKATVADFNYTLQVKVPDDGLGRALGVRRKIELSEDELSSDRTLNLGETPLKEVTSIIGKLSFVDAGVSLAGADVFIPGKPFFVRTGDDGSFSLLFVPSGVYNVRITKDYYIKDVQVSVIAGKTSNLGTVSIGSSERNPLPLVQVMPGSWSSKCYYNDIASGINIENPRLGTITITALDQVAVTGHSCLLRTFAAGESYSSFTKLVLLGDGAIAAKFNNFFTSLIVNYNNNQIVMDIDGNALGSGKFIEVWSRN